MPYTPYNTYESHDSSFYTLKGRILEIIPPIGLPDEYQGDSLVMFECEQGMIVNVLICDPSQHATVLMPGSYYKITESEYYDNINAYAVMPGKIHTTALLYYCPPTQIIAEPILHDTFICTDINGSEFNIYLSIVLESTGVTYQYNGTLIGTTLLDEVDGAPFIDKIQIGDRLKINGTLYRDSVEYHHIISITLLNPEQTIESIGVTVNSLNALEDLKDDLSELYDAGKCNAQTKEKLAQAVASLTAVITTEVKAKLKPKKIKKLPMSEPDLSSFTRLGAVQSATIYPVRDLPEPIAPSESYPYFGVGPVVVDENLPETITTDNFDEQVGYTTSWITNAADSTSPVINTDVSPELVQLYNQGMQTISGRIASNPIERYRVVTANDNTAAQAAVEQLAEQITRLERANYGGYRER